MQNSHSQHALLRTSEPEAWLRRLCAHLLVFTEESRRFHDAQQTLPMHARTGMQVMDVKLVHGAPLHDLALAHVHPPVELRRRVLQDRESVDLTVIEWVQSQAKDGNERPAPVLGPAVHVERGGVAHLALDGDCHVHRRSWHELGDGGSDCLQHQERGEL